MGPKAPSLARRLYGQMSWRKILISTLAATLLASLAEARPQPTRPKPSHIKKSAKYNHITGPKNFKYKAPKKQKLRKHPGQR